MSAIMKATPWNPRWRRPNWRRSFAYAAAASYAACASPSAMAAMPMRPPSSVFRKSLSPSPSAPRRFSAGMRQSSKMSSPVLLAWRPIFSSMRPMLNPGVSASTMKALIFPAVLLAIGHGGDDVRAGHAGVGDEALAAVEHPLVAVAVGAGLRAARVAARSGLGQPVGADDLAGGHRAQVALLLGIGAGQPDRVAAEAGVGADDDPDAAADTAELLDGDGVGQRVEPRSADLLRVRHAQEAERRRPRE